MTTLLHSRWRVRLSGTLLAGVLLLAGQSAQAQVDNYQFAPSQSTFTPLPATATVVSAIHADDAISAVLPIGFTFVYDGTPYTTFRASSNGFLSFNANAGSNLSNNLSGTATERPLIAPLWDDLGGQASTSNASYEMSGTAPNRVLTFEWKDWEWRYTASGPVISFQVKLYETSNRVEIIYRPEANSPDSPTASIGLAGAGSGNGSYLSVSDGIANPTVSSTSSSDNIVNRPVAGQKYTFTPPVPSACPAPRNLTATVSGVTANVSWTVTNGTGPFSVVYGPTGFNPLTSGTTLSPITGTSTTIQNLVPGSYQYYVIQNCGGTAGNSTLSNPGGFSVACPTPSGLTVGTLTNTTAQLSWSSPVTTSATFTIIYGPPGFDPVTSGSSVTGITGTNYTLTGLSPATNYTFYVRQICLGGGTSTAPAGPIAFTTPLTAPANDDPCGAILLTSRGPVTATNSGATTSGQSGITTPVCSPAVSPQDVWFAITPSGTSTTLNMTGTAAGMVRVYSSPSCSAGPFTLVACQSSGSVSTGLASMTATGLTPGQRYYVAVSGYSGGSAAGTFTIAGTALATKVQAESKALLVYPNPSNTGQLTLRLSKLGKGEATLLNALGQQVRTQALSSSTAEQTISTRGLATGVYTLRVQIGDDVLTRKVILE
jgi:hypothetical protein